MKRFHYLTCCVDANGEDIENMVDQAREIKRETFLRHVELDESMWGYDRHLRMKNDYHVRYFSSRYQGQRCYYLDHSAIEYVFVADDWKPNRVVS